MTTDIDLAAAFDAERQRLTALAHRMLGSMADAEDAVQEAWLRLARQDPDAIDSVPGWLTTVVGRVCIDALRTRRSRSETAYDEHLPDPIVAEDDGDPQERAALADSVGLALLVVLDSLSPDERLAFVLHDTFGVPFAEIAMILGKTPDATKMLASRAAGRCAAHRSRTRIDVSNGRWSTPFWRPRVAVTSRRCWSCSIRRSPGAPTRRTASS